MASLLNLCTIAKTQNQIDHYNNDETKTGTIG